MIQDKSTRSRMDLIMLMREKEFSVHTRMSFMIHLAYFKTYEEDDLGRRRDLL